jgi:pimeloyl-ACP methyl ester carboxylesterase
MRTRRICRTAENAPSRFPLVLALGLLVVLAVPGLALADLIYLKDGFILHGKLRQLGDIITDPSSKDQFWAPKGNYLVDDDARKIYFSPRQVDEVDSRFLYEGADLIVLQREIYRVHSFPMSPIVKITDISPWDEKGERVFSMQSPDGLLRIQQRMGVLAPHFARVDALRYAWSAHYLTRELGPDTVRELLLRHPALKGKAKTLDATARFKVYRFFVQAGFFDAAERELDLILADLPDQKEKVESFREGLQKLRIAQKLTEIERAYKAGRHQWAQEQLATYPRNVEERLQSRLRILQVFYQNANENLALAQRYLKELQKQVPPGSPGKMFGEAASTILAELNLDNVHRLETFVSHGRLAERDRQQGRNPLLGPLELMSLAITGWLQGNNSAETSIEMAHRLWRARLLVLEYLRTVGVEGRQRLLADYQSDKGLAFDELSQMIAYLPPPEPEAKLSAVPMELKTALVGGRKGLETTYHVQLPPDYHHGRPYPVLLLLHHESDKATDFLQKFIDLGGKNGYILAAPEWTRGLSATCTYSAEEHALVQDVIRDLRRRFQIDSDRVFLLGVGEGGNLAYDIGLAHPDLFAGVMPMSATPRYFSTSSYWRNAQYLPFYVVTGDHGYANPKQNTNRRIFDQWVPKGYPSLYIEYKGRGLEWFHGELPYLFDWMARKKRAKAVPELGRNPNAGPFGEEFQTMRQTDNRFYWLSTDDISDRNLNEAGRWKPTVAAATLQARIFEGNQIHINTRGLKQLTVWLGPDMLIDFDKPVNIRLNQFAPRNYPAKPSLRTLLEDLYQRGDRQRLFFVEIAFNKL